MYSRCDRHSLERKMKRTITHVSTPYLLESSLASVYNIKQYLAISFLWGFKAHVPISNQQKECV